MCLVSTKSPALDSSRLTVPIVSGEPRDMRSANRSTSVDVRLIRFEGLGCGNPEFGKCSAGARWTRSHDDGGKCSPPLSHDFDHGCPAPFGVDSLLSWAGESCKSPRRGCAYFLFPHVGFERYSSIEQSTRMHYFTPHRRDDATLPSNFYCMCVYVICVLYNTFLYYVCICTYVLRCHSFQAIVTHGRLECCFGCQYGRDICGISPVGHGRCRVICRLILMDVPPMTGGLLTPARTLSCGIGRERRSASTEAYAEDEEGGSGLSGSARRRRKQQQQGCGRQRGRRRSSRPADDSRGEDLISHAGRLAIAKQRLLSPLQCSRVRAKYIYAFTPSPIGKYLSPHDPNPRRLFIVLVENSFRQAWLFIVVKYCRPTYGIPVYRRHVDEAPPFGSCP